MISLIQESTPNINNVKLIIPKELKQSPHIDMIIKDFSSFYDRYKSMYGDANIIKTVHLSGDTSFIVEYTGDVNKQVIKNAFRDFISMNFSGGYRSNSNW